MNERSFCFDFLEKKIKKAGLARESNPGPRAPEARIIPLDQRAFCSVLPEI